jgi:hypothetical protein
LHKSVTSGFVHVVETHLTEDRSDLTPREFRLDSNVSPSPHQQKVKSWISGHEY